MTPCQHCGAPHPAATMLCPRTGADLAEAGLCGSRVDRYQVEVLLGGGAFGSVYRARHVRTDALVALKVLKRELMDDAATVDRFMREARAAASVGHEAIVRVYDAEVTPEGLAFIALEFLEGEDLQALARRGGRLHPARVVGLIVQVLEGLGAVHRSGIVHRDMKPANVFVVRRDDGEGQLTEHAKVLDFGISKISQSPGLRNLTLAGTTMGTPGYMPYEQFFDAHDVDQRTDVYAVAAMLFELLAGRKPIEADNFAAVIEQVRIGAAPSLRSVMPSLPVPLCAAVDKGLAKKRERRWATARQFAGALRDSAHFLGQAPALEAPRPLPAHDPQRAIGTRLQTPAPQAADQTEKMSSGFGAEPKGE